MRPSTSTQREVLVSEIIFFLFQDQTQWRTLDKNLGKVNSKSLSNFSNFLGEKIKSSINRSWQMPKGTKSWVLVSSVCALQGFMESGSKTSPPMMTRVTFITLINWALPYLIIDAVSLALSLVCPANFALTTKENVSHNYLLYVHHH